MRVKGKGAKQDENRHRGAIVLDGNVLQVFVIIGLFFYCFFRVIEYIYLLIKVRLRQVVSSFYFDNSLTHKNCLQVTIYDHCSNT